MKELLPCQREPDVFLPTIETRQGRTTEIAQYAIDKCRLKCPREDECLNDALTSAEPVVGIWGGTTTDQRRALKRRSQQRTA